MINEINMGILEPKKGLSIVLRLGVRLILLLKVKVMKINN